MPLIPILAEKGAKKLLGMIPGCTHFVADDPEEEQSTTAPQVGAAGVADRERSPWPVDTPDAAA